jgi:hypothetical protein
MIRYKVAPVYDIKYAEVDRPSPLSDNKIEQTIQEVLMGGWDHDISDNIYDNFKREAHEWIFSTEVNKLKGIEHFNRVDIINGCTQFIDNLYMDGPVQVIPGDYRYHQRLNKAFAVRELGTFAPQIPLIIAMPFPSFGSPHHYMSQILDECLKKDIPVHIDGAWITCCRDIDFDFNHPAIHSVGISLSKGLGLGWNRVGLRYTRTFKQDSITIMNDFRMNNKVLSKIGLHFVRNFQPDYLWQTHRESYVKVCNDFNLTPTRSIYLAFKDNQPVGISPLIRYLEKHGHN